ncbi:MULTISPECIES: MaoC family dehydratase [unclassified Aminobacter]|uniref:MaoC family dehydratase n=1 Tax=unclassified Aminobacter TaxID=2644704 RepID=UPI0004647403|nr:MULTISPECIES: MaoC family dehydratase [unclassified Aminobacter]TWG53935.1 acyl dehydratase [Aminobacter sp. J44]TWH25894.1 acyl dehydratase [Aminobacter sp. J15]
MNTSNREPVTLEDAKNAVGQEIGVSPWRVVSQEMINQFADATDDHQFIHVDPERAASETPFGGTIAHGFLTLSLLSTLAYETIPPIEGAGIGVNYGFESIRFMSPVKSGARIRARFKLAELIARPSGWMHLNYDVTVEVEGSKKPALTARWLTLAAMDKKEATA